MLRFSAAAALGLSLLHAAPAGAFCMYRGEMYAKTTLAQEFRDSPLVVRATVLSSWDFDFKYGRGTLYRLQVEQIYKGRATPTLTFVTERNSGGFYMDRGTKPDIGASYLLFLDPWERGRKESWDIGQRSRNAYFVNYACGQSRAWREVSQRDRARLLTLSRPSRTRAAR
ncbi:hypothetical protein P1X14_14780 [Sphingomonas sp. AOB5]|uniref:hypothetical protein n=1 Tax=Sphingomonas sp. AOB5 TaxID=3034017 RepID=UPI0023F6995B|nr:hypothetical protein [Sphingomonas sp. AOB5]MDF7776518.1 hypothetical protein [Sphingomonas sp. AOB5]